MIINNEKKFVHIAIPRTATTCLNFTLGNESHPEPNLHHSKISEVLEANPNVSDYFKFTFVRNPWDRLVSVYHEFKKRGNKYSQLVTMETNLLSEFDISDNNIENFRNFCKNLKNSNWIDDLFFHNQYDYITLNGNPIMDFVGRYETLNNDWYKIRDIIGYSGVELLTGRESGPKGYVRESYHEPYKNYYTQFEIDVVADIYKKDIEYFNYTF
jgi:hypothetical protein